jgi:hypothetical protein
MGQQNNPMGGASGDARWNGRQFGQPQQQDLRQLANQARQLANDANDVRRQLQQAGINQKDLVPVDEVVKALNALGNEKNLSNPGQLQDLFATAVQKYKALEFEIRKRVDTSNDQMFLSGSEDVPPAFKSLIEQYYRTIGKKGGGK